MADAVQVEESIISKITMATLGCNPSAVKSLPADSPELQNGELPLARIYGKLADVKYQDDKTKGQIYTYFVGSFEAINMQTGEVMRSGKLFLPKGISELVEDATKKAREKDDKASIAFAFEVRSIKATNPIGYSYKVLALKSPEATDELKELRDMIHKAGAVDVKRLTGSQTGKGTTIQGGPVSTQKKTA
jgi:hypothetical protein